MLMLRWIHAYANCVSETRFSYWGIEDISGRGDKDVLGALFLKV